MIPELAQVGPVTIFTHDVFTVLGILAGLALYYRALRRDHVLDGRIVLISLAAILGGAVGARLITSWEIIDEVSRLVNCEEDTPEEIRENVENVKSMVDRLGSSMIRKRRAA